MKLNPQKLHIKDFTYDLPADRIAAYPLPQRDESKLLVYKNGNISEDIYCNLANHIPAESLLIFNNTKVVEARLLFTKSSGTQIEIFCLEPADDYKDITTAMLQKGRVLWKCLIGGAKKMKDEILSKNIVSGRMFFELNAKKIETFSDCFIVEFSWSNVSLIFAEVLHLAGCIPLPPYIKRNAEESDKERYQTIYAKHDGSVAAPTAGLHFTEKLLQKLAEKEIDKNFVTLHVGAGTFQPVKSETMQQHEMHAEFIDVRKELIEDLLKHEAKNIIAVGTTSLRTLESLYWMGLKVMADENISLEKLTISQWEVYERQETSLSKKEALHALLNWMHKNNLEKIISKTQIIIAPGYSLKIVDALITNFHQPQSTLLLLVASIAGENWKKIYEYALENDFRFLSYGDGSLIWNTL